MSMGVGSTGPRYALGSSASDVGNKRQVKYGPTQGLEGDAQKALGDHYGTNSSIAKDGQVVTEGKTIPRLTQYQKDHKEYVSAADQQGRPLTDQEAVAKRTGANAPDSSINHVIASGTGQNVLNKGTLQFNDGAKLVNDNYKAATAPPPKPGDLSTPSGVAKAATARSQAMKEGKEARGKVTKGIADQAAAVGRAQGYSRAIVNERQGESNIDVGREKDLALKSTLTAYQGKTQDERFGAFKGVMKNTFDSPGNLRVGDGGANGKVSTGFDMPLNAQGQPTDRGKRLLQAHQNYAPPELMADNKVFTKDPTGARLTSSKEATNQNVTGPTSKKRTRRPKDPHSFQTDTTKTPRKPAAKRAKPTPPTTS